jgi:hypothetical protein
MEWACGLPFVLTIVVVGSVWVVETGQALRRQATQQRQALQKKALQAGASSLRSGAYEMLTSQMTVPPGRA